METYTDIIKCTNCNTEFKWEYIDDGYRPWMKPYISPVFSYSKNVAICKRKIVKQGEIEYLITHCPNCYADISIECSESMLKKLYS